MTYECKFFFFSLLLDTRETLLIFVCS